MNEQAKIQLTAQVITQIKQNISEEKFIKLIELIAEVSANTLYNQSRN